MNINKGNYIIKMCAQHLSYYGSDALTLPTLLVDQDCHKHVPASCRVVQVITAARPDWWWWHSEHSAASDKQLCVVNCSPFLYEKICWVSFS